MIDGTVNASEDELHRMQSLLGFNSFGKKSNKNKNIVFNTAPTTTTRNVMNDVLGRASESDVQVLDNANESRADKVDLSGSSDDEDLEGAEESENLVDKLPTNYCSLDDHCKVLTTISIDKANSRLATGSRDSKLKLWDFNGMISSLKPFFEVEVLDAHPIRAVDFSLKGDSILVLASWQPLLYDRNGNFVCLYYKGDPYIRDLRNVMGHTSSVTGGQWHTMHEHLFITSSLDSTIRVWDVNYRNKSKSTHFINAGGANKKKQGVTAMFSIGETCFAGDASGRICRWDISSRTSTTPTALIKAHDQDITSVQMTKDSLYLLSRSLDGTLKQWDLRNYKSPLNSVSNLPISLQETNCTYSPNERYILAGVDHPSSNQSGALRVFDRDLNPVEDYEMPSTCVSTTWHRSLNQIFCGLASGELRVLFDPQESKGGVLIPLLKAPKKLAVDDYDLVLGGLEVVAEVHEPLPEIPYKHDDDDVRDQGTWTKDRRAMAPAQPYTITGPGKEGKLGTNLTQFLMRDIIKLDRTRLEDPRAALLKYAKVSEDDPKWVSVAYKDKKSVLAQKVYEDDAERLREEKKRRRN